MELNIGTKIRYSSALGTLTATITDIRVGPTARKGLMNTWLTLDIPAQKHVTFPHTAQIPSDGASLKMYKVEVISE